MSRLRPLFSFVSSFFSIYRAHLWGPFLISFVVVLSYQFSWFDAVDNLIYDTALKLSAREHNEDIVIVSIDQQSLGAIGRWPWNRQHHAELVKNLGGAQAVVFDILFPEENRDYPSGDLSFAENIQEHGHVVLPIHLESLRDRGQILENPPIKPLYEAANRVGHVHMYCEHDSICRSFYAYEGVGSPYWAHISVELYYLVLAQRKTIKKPRGVDKKNIPSQIKYALDRYYDTDFRNGLDVKTPSTAPYKIYRQNQLFIPFDSIAHPFSTISYVDVLSGKVPASAFEGKVVFVGATSLGLGDYLSTPVGLLPGVEINALAYESMLNGTLIKKVRGTVFGFSLFILTFLFTLLIARLNPSQFLLALIFIVCVTLTLEYTLVRWSSLWLPMASFLIGVMIFYPLWNWMKLRFALIFLSQTLERISKYEREARLEYLSYSPKLNALISQDVSTFFNERKSSKGQYVEIVTQTIDQMERALSVAEVNHNLIQRSLSNLQDAVIILNHRGDIVLANTIAEKVFFSGGYRALRVLYDSFSEKSHTQLRRSILKLIDNGEEFSEELESSVTFDAHRIDSGAAISFTSEKNYLLGLGKRISFPLNVLGDKSVDICLLSFVDISKIKEVERSRLDTLNFLSHDLRAPMVSVLALIEQFELTDSNQELFYSDQNLSSRDSSLSPSNVPNSNVREMEVSQLLSRIRKYVQKNLQYSESILQLSRAEELNEEAFNLVDMHSIIDSVFQQVKPVAENANIALRTVKGEDDAWVMGHAELLERVFINLTNNAIKFSPKHTKIVITLSAEKKLIHVTVKDQGEGIETSKIDSIFERYSRGDKKANKLGAGLGLFFVKSVVDKHHGNVSVESKKGEGACFRVSFPSCDLDIQ